MHHRRALYNGIYTHYPTYRHHGVNVYSSYASAQSLPLIHDVNIGVSPYYHDYGYRRNLSYVDYPYYDYASRTIPPIVHNNVRNDIHYHYDDPGIIYDDVYGYDYRVPRSNIQIVDVAPRRTVRTYRPTETIERVIIPRSTVVRYPSLPAYGRARPVRLMPLYRSAIV
jgi:hypothetical protein